MWFFYWQFSATIHLQHSHGEDLPHLSGLPGTASHATCLREVPHLSCESSQEKKRDCMERLVTPPRRGTSPTWGPPPPCEQARKTWIWASLQTSSFQMLLVQDSVTCTSFWFTWQKTCLNEKSLAWQTNLFVPDDWRKPFLICGSYTQILNSPQYLAK